VQTAPAAPPITLLTPAGVSSPRTLERNYTHFFGSYSSFTTNPSRKLLLRYGSHHPQERAEYRPQRDCYTSRHCQVLLRCICGRVVVRLALWFECLGKGSSLCGVCASSRWLDCDW
jgi:hypothetical protein